VEAAQTKWQTFLTRQPDEASLPMREFTGGGTKLLFQAGRTVTCSVLYTVYTYGIVYARQAASRKAEELIGAHLRIKISTLNKSSTLKKTSHAHFGSRFA
jgi:hypothetical protein